MASLEIRNLYKSFGRNTVLNDINLTVPEGEFFVVLGPSGGGKSTLLRILCGIELPDSGEIILNGRNITQLPPRERNIGMVFQDYGLYPHMDVRENIAYGLEARNMPKAVVEERVKAAAAKLGITPLLERVVVDLSGGEQQRVALARALAKDASLYLFDEPLSNLDPKLRVQARRDIVMVHREKHKPTLYVTHDQTEALASGDRIGVIAAGRLQQVGAADDLIQRPANLFVARFIGSPPMNLVSATLEFDARADVFAARFGGQTVLRLPSLWNATL
ncbi:MAG: ABC transporter ATP-binding protein, partial [Anaerolineae bacterium]|nr:ABC transporter ATP-binding protein [Anaerolineae bacterium]